MKRALAQLFWLFCFGLMVARIVEAQVGVVNNKTSTPTWGVGHDYIQALSETVNPQNGSVSVRIAGPVPPARGITTPQFVFNYDSNLPRGAGTGFLAPVGDTSTGITVGWQGGTVGGPNSLTNQSIGLSYQVPNGGPFLYCGYYTDYVYTDSLGQRHPLGLSKVPLVSENPSCSEFGVTGSVLSGGDSQYAAQLDQNTGFVYVTDPHGRVITSVSAPTLNTYEDSNGNTGGATHDSMGRTVVATSGNSATYSGISNPFAYVYGSQSWNYNVNARLLGGISSGSCGSSFYPNSGSASLVTGITLPNNQQYKFHYEPIHGLLDKVTYPTGATVTYTWAANLQSEAIGFANNAYPNGGASAVCQYRYDGFAIVKRVVSFDGSTSALEQDFSYIPTTWNANNPTYWISKQTLVTTRDLLRPGQPSYQTIYNYTPTPAQRQPNDFNSFPGQIPLESSIVYQDANGSVLKTVFKTWAGPDVLGSECVMLPNGMTSGTFYSYTGFEPTDKKEYDYGQVASGTCTQPSSTPVRETTTAYQSFPATPLFHSQPSIFDRPSSVKIYDHGTLIAETDYAYDQTAVSSISSLTGHDETNYSSSYNNRGNLTTKTVKCFQTGCVDAITKYTYDEAGQVLSVVDPNGNVSGGNPSQHTTNYSYADSYTSGGTPPGSTDGYLTKVTYPAVNGVTQAKSFSYNYAGGQLNAATDPNSKTTTYTYNDPFVRPTSVNYPDGGQSEITYNDTAPSPTVTSCQLINGAAGATCSASTPAPGWKTSMAKADGMGHAVQTQLASDPDGADSTDTTYDGLGRVWTHSNPHRLGSSSTDGTTTYYYDGLGRVCLVVPPDGTQPAGSTCPSTRPTGDVLTTYSNNCTTVTDEAGKARTSCSDGLGRLTQVFEDSAGLNYETDYNYDALGNLLTVTQKGGTTNSALWRIRNFTYDSLSRLLTANNPESGTITYAYDADGNVITKTAPAPNQTGTATVVTTNTYDALNRPYDTTYSDGTQNSDSRYDDSVEWGATMHNYIGRPTLASAAVGAIGTIYDHDPMGRVSVTYQNPPGFNSRQFSFSYYLDGSLQSITYPSGRKITYGVNSAGRYTSVTDADGTNYATNAHYAPFGGLTGMSLGAKPITVSDSYNKRLQPNLLSASTTAATILSLSYNFHLGAGDNGNVFQIVNNRDNNRTQNFMYDSLNRIQQAYTSGTNWGETFGPTATSPGVAPSTPGIDAWGNLTNRSAVTGKTLTEGLSVSATVKNQLTGFGYDAAGNMTSNGSATYSYDGDDRVTNAGGYTYTYDANSVRIKKASGSAGVLYWYGLNGEVLAESDLSGNFSAEYIFFNGQRVARRDSSGAVHYYFSDHLGTHSLVTDAIGTMPPQDESDFYPYGGEIPIVNNDSNHYKFTGKERDSESSLDYFGARHYTSAMGRFMQPDEPFVDQEDSNPQSWNLYSYVLNNPLKSVDPDGNSHSECKKDENGQDVCYTVGDKPGELLLSPTGNLQWNDKTKEWDPVHQNSPLENVGWFANYALEQTVGNWVDSLGQLSVAKTPFAAGIAAVGLLPLSLGQGEVKTATGVIQISEHAAKRMAERGVTTEMVEKAIQVGEKFFDPKYGSDVYVIRKGMASGKDLAVAVKGGELSTVMVNRRAVSSRFIPVK